MSIIAIDQGTTSTRALLPGSDGRLVVAASRRHRQIHPGPGMVEHDPGEILDHIRAVIAAARARLDPAGPAPRLALANQGETCLGWDAVTGRALSPMIVWQDARTAAHLAALGPEAAALSGTRSGLPLDPYFSASKLGWILENCPAAAAAHRAGRLRLGTSDAYFLQNLGGNCATDITTASRTGLMNLASGTWDGDLCALHGVPVETLPEIRASDARFGTHDGMAITAAMTDQQAALHGHGCDAPGAAKITFGTGAFLLVNAGTTPSEPPPGLLPTVAWEKAGRRAYAIDAGIYDAGSAVEWARRAGWFADPSEIACFDGPRQVSRGLVFVPAFSGLAAPDWDRDAAPLILGMRPDTMARDMLCALLEGIALMTARLVATLGAHIDPARPIRIDGGLSQSPHFAALLAAALDRPVHVAAEPETTGLGLMRMAGLAVADNPADRLHLPDGSITAADHARFAAALERAGGWRSR